MKLSYTRKYASQVENTLTIALILSAFCANAVEKTVGIQGVFRRMKLRPVSNGLRSVEKKRWNSAIVLMPTLTYFAVARILWLRPSR